MGHKPEEEGINILQMCLVYLGYILMYLCGHMWEKWAKLVAMVTGKQPSYTHTTPEGYAPLFVESDSFYIRWLYKRISDAWDRPITNIPGAYIDVLEREGHNMNNSYSFTGKKLKCLNLGSYNYLGFAQNDGPVLESSVKLLVFTMLVTVPVLLKEDTQPFIKSLNKLLQTSWEKKVLLFSKWVMLPILLLSLL